MQNQPCLPRAVAALQVFHVLKKIQIYQQLLHPNQLSPGLSDVPVSQREEAVHVMAESFSPAQVGHLLQIAFMFQTSRVYVLQAGNIKLRCNLHDYLFFFFFSPLFAYFTSCVCRRNISLRPTVVKALTELRKWALILLLTTTKNVLIVSVISLSFYSITVFSNCHILLREDADGPTYKPPHHISDLNAQGVGLYHAVAY